jgi:hypothetical protein
VTQNGCGASSGKRSSSAANKSMAASDTAMK